MSSPFQLQQLILNVETDSSPANIQALLQCVSTWIPVPLGAECTGKKCPNCSFKMHNKCKKCPHCYHILLVSRLVETRCQVETRCHKCGKPHEVLVRMVCGCNYCSRCLAERLETAKYCAMHNKIFQKKQETI
jgi:hypothetical protein